jgi:hypothetical protein
LGSIGDISVNYTNYYTKPHFTAPKGGVFLRLNFFFCFGAGMPLMRFLSEPAAPGFIIGNRFQDLLYLGSNGQVLSPW